MMEKLFEILLKNPWATFIVFASISIFLWVASKTIPNPINLLIQLLNFLKKEEFTSKPKKGIVEKINLISIIFLFIITVLEIMFWGGQSLIGRIFATSQPSFPSGLLLTLIFLFTISVFSPLIILFARQDITFKKQSRELSDNTDLN